MGEPALQILVFGDARWATLSLQRLVERGYNLLGVVLRARPTDPNLARVAGELGLPIFQPKCVNSPAFVGLVADLAPDLNLSVSYDQILHRPVLETSRLGFVNFHAGMLPCYRGRNVINWALINGESEIGLTAHFVDEGIDTGDILHQRSLPISWTDTYGDVLSRVEEAIPELVSETVDQIALGSPKRRPQSPHMGTYFAARGEGDEWLDWSDTSRNLYNKIRAITCPGPGARTLLGEKQVTIWRASYDQNWPRYMATPGQVVGKRPGEGVFVKTGDSVILAMQIQIDDTEPEIPNWRIGTRLGLNLWDYLHLLENRLKHLERLAGEKHDMSHC